MCAIIGEIRCKNDEPWIQEHIQLALKRGKDLTNYRSNEVNLYHTRLATNDSQDTYPIIIDNAQFSMNGIIGEKKYKELVGLYGNDVGDYTVDSAFFLRLWLDKKDWTLFDTDNFVFAFWLIEGRKIYLGNKDYPLFIKHDGIGIRFSSFKSEGFEPMGNRVFEYDLDTKEYKEQYEFKDLVYGG